MEIKFIIRPPRDEYDEDFLGEKEFNYRKNNISYMIIIYYQLKVIFYAVAILNQKIEQ